MAKSVNGGRHSGSASVGIVVPTLGTRPDYLGECVSSIRSAGEAHIAIVRPLTATIAPEVLELVDVVLDDPGTGLAAAINTGIRSLPDTVRFASWLGDDDRLVDGTLPLVVNELERTGAAAVFGQCRYIDGDGRLLWLNKSGRWASPLMLCGPQLVPQPGSLFNRGDFEAIGGLDENRKWAFDLEMFLQLRRRPGGLRFLSTPLAEFRWHEGSLSVGGRVGSVTEASEIRRHHLKPPLRQLSAIWEPALRRLILWAGERMNRRLSAIR
jgi:GT2 family glycosyltransferase